MRYLVSLLLCLAVVGCDSGPQQARGVRVTSWSTSTSGQESVPGIDQAQVAFGTFGERPAVVIWSDDGGSFGVGYNAARRGASYSGTFRAQDAREYAVEAFTADGKTGEVKVDGQTFDLANGSLFLIRTGDGGTTVKQLRVMVPMPTSDDEERGASASDELREFAMKHAEIREFFEEAIYQEN